MPKKYTTDIFVEKAKVIHNNEYEYKNVNYLNSYTRIFITCRIHGDFLQLPYHHLRGSKCPKCVNRDLVDNERFIQKATIKHGNFYDYSKVKYINNFTKVKIICNKHGFFLQRPNSHLMGEGCPKCKIDKLIQRNTKNEKYYRDKIKKKHGLKYEYPNFSIKNKKITILCKKHGIFRQDFHHHLCGRGCSKCSNTYNYSTDEFIKRAKKIHNQKYDYSKVKYKNNKTKITIICKKHGKFLQNPGSHIAGKGCPKCTFKISKPEIEFLDFLNIKNRHVYIKPYNVDGYDKRKKIIYEFLGDFYHGNPEIFNKNDYNKICHKTFGELFLKTIKKFKKLKHMKYKIKYIWENDWNNFKKGFPLKLQQF